MKNTHGLQLYICILFMHMYFCINYAIQATLKNHFCVKKTLNVINIVFASYCVLVALMWLFFLSKSKANKGILNVIDSFTRYLKYTKKFRMKFLLLSIVYKSMWDFIAFDAM